MNFLLMIGMYAAWTSIFSLGKMTLNYCPPIFLTGARMLLAGVLLIGYLLFRNRKSLILNKSQWIPLILLSIFSIYLTNILEFWGVQYLSAAKTCFIYSLSPFFAALFSYLHFGERMNARKWIGMLIGFIGFVPVLLMQSGSEGLFRSAFVISWPELAIMGAALCSVYGWVLLRLMVKDSSFSPLLANGGSMLIGGLFALIHSLIIDNWSPTPIVAGGFLPFLKGTLLMTFISNILCYNLYGHLLKRFTATFMSFMGLLSPIFASFTGWLILGETPSWQIFLSTTIVASGLWIIYKAELKQGYIVQKKSQAQETA